jgi:hypothetical protein
MNKNRLNVFQKQGAEVNTWAKGGESIRGWRQLHTEELHNLYSSPSIIRMIKSMRMG